MGLSQTRLALGVGVPPRRINEIVLGKRGVSADTALRLARYFDMSPQFWLGLQMDYDLDVAAEQEILESVERGEWERAPRLAEEAVHYQTDAEAALGKDRRVNIRISERDLLVLQQKAVEEGLPYQTLIASILHKYVSGRLVDKSA